VLTLRAREGSAGALVASGRGAVGANDVDC
jgi:hypothetical protein